MGSERTSADVAVARRAPSRRYRDSREGWTSERASHRHHHARRDRAHGHEPAPRALHPRDPQEGACASPTARGSCPIRSWSAATPTSSRSSRERTASSAGPPISRRRSANRRTRCSSTPLPRRLRPSSISRRSRPASTSTAKSRSRRHSRTRSTSTGPRRGAGVKHGVVQDKLWLPGLLKLQEAARRGFFGRILSVRGEFGYWVFEGDWQPAQRPSWNYRKRGRRRHHPRHAVPLALRARQPVRRGAGGELPRRDAHSAALGRERQESTRRPPTTRPMRPSSWRAASSRTSTAHGACACGATISLTLQVDGTQGTAVAGLRAASSSRSDDAQAGVESGHPAADRFLRRLAGGAGRPDVGQRVQGAVGALPASTSPAKATFRWNLLEGAKGVQLAELGLKSWKERRWLEVPALKA